MGNSKNASHVLKALGYNDKIGENIIRISLLDSATEDDISQFLVFLQNVVASMEK